MTIQRTAAFLNRAVTPCVRVIAFAGGCGLMFMMVLVACDVILRFFNRPISGAYELVEYSMAITVSFGITVCSHQGGHIKVDILTDALKKNTKNVLACLMSIVAIAYTLPIMWQALLYIQEMYASNMTSAVLLIPVYPFTAIVALSFIATTIVFIADLFNFLAEIKTQWTR
jgi:TRAP-type C4-dicarboxylate transport system permease small subunit